MALSLRSRNRLVFFTFIVIFVVVFIAPQIVLRIWSRAYEVQTNKEYDIAVVLGAHLDNNGQPTELLYERIEAGKQLYQNDVIDMLVVSNTQEAAEVMAGVLEQEGVPLSDVILDLGAETTVDSCTFDGRVYLEGASVVLVSQRFHLPRALFQCRKRGVDGFIYPAELSSSIDRSGYSFFTKMSARSQRFLREATLTWLAVLGIYE